MHFHKFFEVGEVKDAKIGDLVKIPWSNGHNDIAIIYAFENDQSKAIILRTTSKFGYVPYSDNLNLSDPCINYGSDWIIEPEESFETKFGSLEHPGDLAFTSEQVILKLGPLKQGQQPSSSLKFSLTNLEIYKGHLQNTYLVKSWRVWVNETQKDEQNAKPIVTIVSTPILLRG
jgi:hypothetical protein